MLLTWKVKLFSKQMEIIAQKNIECALAFSGGWELSSFYILLSIFQCVIFLKWNSKTKQQMSLTVQNLDSLFVGISPTTCYLTLIYPLCLLLGPSFFFLLCFKINFIDIKFRHDKLYPFNMYSLWALTDVHTCEIKIQNVFTIFKWLCPCCRPCLLGSWPQASTPCFVSLFSPLLEVHLNAFTFYVAFCVWFCT